MSILIKGMDKPTDCGVCPFEDFGYCNVKGERNTSESGIDNDCPLIEVADRKTEPQTETQTETQNSNLTFEKDECAKEYEELGLKELKELINADRKTEPKPICESCSKNPCKKKEMINDIGHWVSECTEFDRKTEPQTCEWCKFYDGENCFSQEPCKVMLYFKTEPQTDCGWK